MSSHTLHTCVSSHTLHTCVSSHTLHTCEGNSFIQATYSASTSMSATGATDLPSNVLEIAFISTDRVLDFAFKASDTGPSIHEEICVQNVGTQSFSRTKMFIRYISQTKMYRRQGTHTHTHTYMNTHTHTPARTHKHNRAPDIFASSSRPNLSCENQYVDSHIHTYRDTYTYIIHI